MEENKQSDAKPKGLSVAAMVCGICGLAVPYLGILSGIAGIILAIIALIKIKKGQADGKGMAIAGLVTGIVSFVLYGVIIFLLVWSVVMIHNSVSTVQMDTIRRDNYATISEKVSAYLVNNSGQLPSIGDNTFSKAYLSDLYDPSTNLPYNVVIRDNSGIMFGDPKLESGDVFIEVGSGYDCYGDLRQSSRFYRVIGYLDSGFYCSDN